MFTSHTHTHTHTKLLTGESDSVNCRTGVDEGLLGWVSAANQQLKDNVLRITDVTGTCHSMSTVVCSTDVERT